MKRRLAVVLAALPVALPARAQYDNPGVFISPTTGTYTTGNQAVRITWTHEYDLISTSYAIVFNGSNVTSSFTYEPQTGYSTGSGVRAVSNGSVVLNPGNNTLTASICGSGSGCTTEEVVLTYQAPPAPAQRVAPAVSVLPHHPTYANPLRYGSTLTYSTPSYVSMDRARAVTLYYSSELASPHPFVQFDVTDASLEPASMFSVRALQSGTVLPLSNGAQVAYFSNQGAAAGSTSRLGVQLDGSTVATGAYVVTLEVTSHWSNGSLTSTQTVRVPMVNRASSPYGAGWGVLGLQRIHVQTDGLVVDEGDGSVRFFAGSGPSYTTPQGDFSTLIRTTAGTYQRTWPDGAAAGFDGTGRLLYTSTSAGDTTRYEYTGNDRLLRIVDPAGQAAVFDYNAANYLAGITVPGGRRTRFSYTGTDVSAITEPDSTSALQQITYSAGHRLDSWVDRAGGTWNVTYGAQHAVTVTGPQITVNGTQAQRPATTMRSEKRLLVPVAGQGTSSAPMARVPLDSVYSSVTDARGHTTRLSLDRYGQPVRLFGPLGHTTVIERNPHGQPVRITGSAGTSMDLDWNTNGTIARSFDESRGLQVDYAYQTLNGSTFLTHASEGRVNTAYDRGARGEVLRVRVGNDTVARFTYDTLLRVRTAQDRGGHTVEYFYDGSAWRNTDSVRFVTSLGNQRSAYTYDAAGRLATRTAPDGRVSTYSYDALNRPLKVRAPGDSVRYTYDARGLWKVTDAKNQVYEFNRNALGWVETERDTNGRPTSYRYDIGGYVVGTTDRAARQFSMRYDALGRLDSLSAPDATVRYGFDNPAGRWIWAERVGESRDTLYLDGAGQVHTAVSVMNGVRYAVQSTYELDGQRSQVAVQAGPWNALLWQEVMNYGYDTRRRLEVMTDQSGYATTITYGAEGLPATVTWPNSAATLTLGYTPRHQIGSMSYNRASLNTGLGAGTMAYDVLNRLESRTSTDGQRTTQYTYDPLGRLSGRDELKQVYVPPPPFCTGNSTEPECDGYYDWTSVRTHGYGYDAVGNRTGWTYSDSMGVSLSSSATLQPSSNRYAGFGGWTLAYDSVGNLISRTSGGQTVQYQWNSLGQLTGVYTPTGGWVYYGYNGFGRRVRRTAGGVTTRYVYDGDDLVAEVDTSGNRIRTYAYWPGIDQPHSMRTWENGANGAVHYYGMELPSNTVRGLFNMSGTLTHSYQYSPFGEKLAQSESTHNPLRFAGRELDTQTGMYYVRARWYDPFLGRFLSEDPIGLAGGINPYAYAGNDPVNRRDPSGLTPCSAYWIISGGVVNRTTLVVSDGCNADNEHPAGGRQVDGMGPGNHSKPGPGAIQSRHWQETECQQLAAAAGDIAGSSRDVMEFGKRIGSELAGVSNLRDLFGGGTNVLHATVGGYTPDNGGNATGQARHFAASAFAYTRYGGPFAHLGFWYNETYRAGANREDYNLSVRAFQMIADVVVYSQMGTAWTREGMGEVVENWISRRVCAQ